MIHDIPSCEPALRRSRLVLARATAVFEAAAVVDRTSVCGARASQQTLTLRRSSDGSMWSDSGRTWLVRAEEALPCAARAPTPAAHHFQCVSAIVSHGINRNEDDFRTERKPPLEIPQTTPPAEAGLPPACNAADKESPARMAAMRNMGFLAFRIGLVGTAKRHPSGWRQRGTWTAPDETQATAAVAAGCRAPRRTP